MNWGIILLLVIVAFGALAGFVYSVMKHSFGPFCDEDVCSEANPERDYDHRRH